MLKFSTEIEGSLEGLSLESPEPPGPLQQRPADQLASAYDLHIPLSIHPAHAVTL